jgi:hypothetical protein
MKLGGDAVVGVGVVLIGVFFLWGAGRIDVYGDDAIPSDFFPRVIATLMIVAGVVLAASGLRRRHAELGDLSDLVRVTLPLVALTITYILLWRQVGYLLASLAVAPLIFVAFGNRGLRHALLVPAAVVLGFFLVFFTLMGLHDAPGRLLDQAPLNRLLGA